MLLRRCALVVGAGGVAAVAVGEASEAVASRMLVPGGAHPPDLVVVLGYHNRHPSQINRVNRWRVQAGVRSMAPGSRLLLCGGARQAGATSEAALMAGYALGTLGVDPAVVSLDESSMTTWENVAHAIPAIEQARRVAVVSQPLHALKARWYLRRQRPDLADRLVRGREHRLGEGWARKPLYAAYGMLDLARSGVSVARARGGPPALDVAAAERRRVS